MIKYLLAASSADSKSAANNWRQVGHCFQAALAKVEVKVRVHVWEFEQKMDNEM